MSSQLRWKVRYAIPPLFGLACLVGVLVNQFVIVAIVAAVVSSVLYTVMSIGDSGSGEKSDHDKS